MSTEPVKVICFDTLLQVLILNNLHGTKIMQSAVSERQLHLLGRCTPGGICMDAEIKDWICHRGTGTEKDRNATLEAATKVRSVEWNPSYNALKARKNLEVADPRWERRGGTPTPGVL